MYDKAAFISSVYSRYRAQTSNVNVISPAFKRLAESEFAFFMFICLCRCRWNRLY